MVFRDLVFELAAIHAPLVQAVLLVVSLEITELSSERCALVTCLSEHAPAAVVVVVVVDSVVVVVVADSVVVVVVVDSVVVVVVVDSVVVVVVVDSVVVVVVVVVVVSVSSTISTPSTVLPSIVILPFETMNVISFATRYPLGATSS